MAVRIAILDMYEGVPNQGMRCIRQIIKEWSAFHSVQVETVEFDVRQTAQVPGTDFDLYISSGGPGDPTASEGSEWENAWLGWVQQIEEWNANPANPPRYVFFICHSFQMACRHYRIGKLTKRNSTAFGVFPVHVTLQGQHDAIFQNLKDPFYVVDSRDYQVTSPDFEIIESLGSNILCIEKYRPHVPYEQALMGVRFNPYMVGTQFHPEADAVGMSMYLQIEDRKKTVIENHGEEKWSSMVEQLNDPDKIMWTYAHLLPNFLDQVLAS